MSRSYALLAVLASFGAACGAPEGAPAAAGDELPLGDQLPDDFKADGQWGAALTCKAAPSLPRLVAPRITISLDGLSLHLTDPASGFDKVFPVGVGQINTNAAESSFGESLSYYPLIATGGQDFTIKPSGIQPCKTWWTDPETGKQQPVFAGLPFMSFFGNYAIHGPIDNFRAANGGSLRRGYVSHGCVRMEAADVLEVYARIKGLASVPVHVQREPERSANGRRVDVPAPFIGAECAADGDCAFPNGFCKQNRYSGRGFCSARCTSTCADRAGQPTTFCVADPDDATQGMCVSKMTAVNADCRPNDHLVPTSQPRFRQTTRATVCMPGSRGWIGDRCLAAGDCRNGTTCNQGVCTQPCARFCPDQPGWSWTFCAADPALGGTCLRQCTPQSNAPECAGGQSCVSRPRVGQPGLFDHVCVPN